MPQIVKHDDINYRAFQPLLSTVDEETRSVEGVIATDSPVLAPDFTRMQMVPEVLRMDGIELPENGQIPLLNNHNRESLDTHLGSIRNLRTEGSKFVGRLFFAKSSQSEWEKVRDGHV